MCLAIVDADTAVFKACMIAEKTVYDILPLQINDIPTDQVVDIEDDTTYQQYILQTCRYVKEYKDWLKNLGKTEKDFLRVSRVVMEPLSHALHVLDTMMKEIIKAVQPEQLVVLLTGDDNFRDDIAKMRPYKETRRNKPKPQYYQAAREFLIKKYRAKVINKVEADDQTSILATATFDDEEPYVIVAVDKDLNSVPGLHYDYDKKKWYNVTVHEAEQWFWIQVLAGDSTDCIPGLHMMGEKGARKLLGKSQSFDSMYQKVKKAYADHFTEYSKKPEQIYAKYKHSSEYLTEIGRLVHMQRYVGEMWSLPEK